MSSSESSRRFHFIREIASGGFGSVYLAKVIHPDGFSRLYAVKLLHPRWTENEEIASRMRDEARLLGWLRHKNIVDVTDLTLIDGRCAVIMEYLEAVDTKMLINDAVKQSSRVPLRAALEMCAAVASALDAAYNRPPYPGEKPLHVIHRDIKPSNIMVDESGVVKVLDFGVARAEFDERESKTQEIAFGSLDYMPPERLFFEPESPASDIYSLGATLYEMLALEKFGKAKLRPKDHESFFEDRFDVLLDRYPLHQEAEDLLHELLMSMLAFEEPERPTAADAVTKLRAFARRIPEHPLEEWAETTVPGILSKNRAKEEQPSPGSLVGATLTEDAKGIDQNSVWEENTGASTKAMEFPQDDELTGTMAQNERWNALKQATIEDMAKRGEIPVPTEETPIETPKELEPSELPDGPRPQPSNVPIVEDTAPVPLAPILFSGPADTSKLPALEEPEPDEPAGPPLQVDPEPAVVETEGPDPRMLVGLAGLLLLAFVGVVLILFVLIGLLVGALSSSPAGPTVVPPPATAKPSPVVAPAAEPEPNEQPKPEPEPEPEPEPVVPAGPSLVITSARTGTKKLNVRCSDSGTHNGSTELTIAGSKHGKCRVTAILSDRTRLRATIDKAEARAYRCFEGSDDSCK